MTVNAETIALCVELIAAFSLVVGIVLPGIVWLLTYARSFRGCLRCGCELNKGGGNCLMCGHPLRRPRSWLPGNVTAKEARGEPRAMAESPSCP